MILISTIIDYVAGLWMGKLASKKKRLPLLILSLSVNLGLLFFFKYFNFFNEVLLDFASLFRIPFSPSLHKLLLPVGISFYTFQTLSYSIDVYRGKLNPEKSFLKFAVFVSFFPQLVAGPIERASNLIPQFSEEYSFDKERIINGLQLILWGFFKKIVIADRIAIIVDSVYANPHDFSGGYFALATYLFAIQIYCDFSGYSDIAIGTARIMGFDLMTNFKKPYFAISIKEFWSKWHISLSTWFRDYVYIPLGGNRVSKFSWYRNIVITFVVSGIWHGANWTFIAWGFLHGFYLLIETVFSSKRIKLPSLIRGIITFHLILLAWVFFRSNSIGDAVYILKNTFVSWEIIDYSLLRITEQKYWFVIVATLIFIVVEAIDEKWNVSMKIRNLGRAVRPILYLGMLIVIMLFGVWDSSSFIYFQF
ncbi:MBOAT family O-acyltransferase [Ekhidna sp.]|uniref:MBOAT family O-acyltransferase n=1 Tax=Ekhidna sp. TaxID=2608089 RepID=UPI003299F858